MATEIWVQIGSGNGLLPSGNKPLPEPRLIYHQGFLWHSPNDDDEMMITSYSIRNLGQWWCRQLLQAIAWTNVDLPSIESHRIHLAKILKPELKISSHKMSWKIITGPWFSIKMSSYQLRKSHCEDKTILWPSYLHNGISYTGKTTSLYPANEV